MNEPTGFSNSLPQSGWVLDVQLAESIGISRQTLVDWLIKFAIPHRRSAHDDNWPMPKPKVLCAIYAGIGDRQMRRMTRLLLRAHGAGFASPKGIKPAPLLSEKQVRYWADKLWMKNLFQMAADGQDLWYSNRFKNDQELARVVKLQVAAAKTKTVIQVGDI